MVDYGESNLSVFIFCTIEAVTYKKALRVTSVASVSLS